MFDNILTDGMLGLAVGDALGVPYESCSLEQMRAEPCTGMVGYRHHNQPTGSWSDDTSMALCTADSLCKGFDPTDMMKKFILWKNHRSYTATGVVFDIGRKTRKALQRFEDGSPAEYCGGTSVESNGNGSLMRIFPMAVWQCLKGNADDEHIDEFLAPIHAASEITHGHAISLICCGLFALTLREWLLESEENVSFLDIAERAFQKGRRTYLAMGGDFREEMEKEAQFLSPYQLKDYREEDLPAWGFVLNSWHMAVWGLVTTNNYRDCVLKMVNRGYDTDSNAAIAGALAGVIYGKEAIPEEWVNELQNKQLIEEICDKLNRSLLGKTASDSVIEDFSHEYCFLSMKSEANVTIDGHFYPNTASAFYALGVPEEYRNDFSMTNAKQARKAYKHLPRLSEEEAPAETRLYKATKAKFEQNEKYAAKLIQTGEREIIYNTTGSHDNVLGRCQCADCKGKEYRNLYGKVLMRVREERKGAENGKDHRN